MRQAGRYLPEYQAIRKECNDFMTLCYDSNKAAEVTLQPIRRFDFDAAILFSDILVIPDALGCKVSFIPGKGPTLSAIDSKAAVNKLDFHRTHLQPVMDTITKVKSELATDKALIGFAGSPWTVATYMVEGGSSRDFHRSLKAYFQCDWFNLLLEKITESTVEYLKAQIDQGVDVIQLFDSWAQEAPIIAREALIYHPTKYIVDQLKNYAPHIPIIGFPKGFGLDVVTYQKYTSVDGISVDHLHNIGQIVDALPKHVVVQGNIDPRVLAFAQDKLSQEVTRLKEAVGNHPFICNLGHGILPMTSPESVSQLIKEVRLWQKK